MAKKYKYKNITEEDLVVVGIGVVKAGETIEVDTPIENPNLKLVSGENMVGIDPVTPKPNKHGRKTS